ncbi:hypothetical protein ACLX1H_008034 [Fusarium chlamydosporum]
MSNDGSTEARSEFDAFLEGDMSLIDIAPDGDTAMTSQEEGVQGANNAGQSPHHLPGASVPHDHDSMNIDGPSNQQVAFPTNHDRLDPAFSTENHWQPNQDPAMPSQHATEGTFAQSMGDTVFDPIDLSSSDIPSNLGLTVLNTSTHPNIAPSANANPSLNQTPDQPDDPGAPFPPLPQELFLSPSAFDSIPPQQGTNSQGSSSRSSATLSIPQIHVQDLTDPQPRLSLPANSAVPSTSSNPDLLLPPPDPITPRMSTDRRVAEILGLQREITFAEARYRWLSTKRRFLQMWIDHHQDNLDRLRGVYFGGTTYWDEVRTATPGRRLELAKSLSLPQA